MRDEKRREWERNYYRANREKIKARYLANKEKLLDSAKKRRRDRHLSAFQAGAKFGYEHGTESRLVENAFCEWFKKKPRSVEAAQR